MLHYIEYKKNLKINWAATKEAKVRLIMLCSMQNFLWCISLENVRLALNLQLFSFTNSALLLYEFCVVDFTNIKNDSGFSVRLTYLHDRLANRAGLFGSGLA